MRKLQRPKFIDINCDTFFLIQNENDDYMLFDFDLDYAIVNGSFNIVMNTISMLPKKSIVFKFKTESDIRRGLKFENEINKTGITELTDQSFKNSSKLLPEKKDVGMLIDSYYLIQDKTDFILFDKYFDIAIEKGNRNKVFSTISKKINPKSKIFWYTVSKSNLHGLKWKATIDTTQKV